jgi:hypothetical protein
MPAFFSPFSPFPPVRKNQPSYPNVNAQPAWEDWREMVNRRWNEFGEQESPITASVFCEWLQAQLLQSTTDAQLHEPNPGDYAFFPCRARNCAGSVMLIVKPYILSNTKGRRR